MFDIPFLDIPPLRSAGGTVRLPGSKSISNRVLLLAGLCEGSTRVLQPLDSDDTRVMLEALKTLGCGVEPSESAVTVKGLGRQGPRVAAAELFLGNAGTAMRPLAAMLAVGCLSRPGHYVLKGVPRMHERPIRDLVDALRPLGCGIEYLQTEGYPPLSIRTPERSPDHPQAPIRVRGDVSSQFLTALLMSLPLLTNQGEVVIEVEGELISKPYIDITINLMRRFGVNVQRDGWRRFTLPQGATYQSPGEILVEGDASSASYFVAAGAIAGAIAGGLQTKEALRIEGIGRASIQGDVRFIDAAQAMGADVELADDHVLVRRGRWPLQAIDLDANAMPDAAMTLAVMALFADGTTRLRGIGSWRVKETDRIAAMAAELRKLGAQVEAGEDFLSVTPPRQWVPAVIQTYDDHRMAMCLSLAAFNPLAEPQPAHPVPVRILDPRCVGKTFPDYFEALFAVSRAQVEDIPVITVDGPTASGKGTLAVAVAERLGWQHLDSGALYRLVALASIEQGVSLKNARGLTALATEMPMRFEAGRVCLAERDVTDDLRHEDVGVRASQVSAIAAVRQALVQRQLGARRLPGLVADGRDMGTTIFPDAPLKVFLTASAATRAERRHKQLISKGFSANLQALRADLEARDERDRSRAASPLAAASDAQLLDNSNLTVDESVDWVLKLWQQRRPFG